MLEHITTQLNQALGQLHLTQEQLAMAHKRIEELEQQNIPSPNVHSQPEQGSHSLGEHVVQFWETDAFLLGAVGPFIGIGLRAGDAGIVVATKSHRECLEERLKADGLDVAAACLRGQYVSIDAAATLSQIMVDGQPSPERFANVIGSIIVRAAKGRRRVRIFGEMVTLLWADGNRAAAIYLEELWNELSHIHSFSLLCSYPMHVFGGQVYEEEFTQICQHHSQVLPAESYSRLSSPDERLRAITALQQKARSLEVELTQRKVAEVRLRMSENRYRRLFEASTDGILLVDPHTGTIIDANPFMTELVGYSREQLQALGLWHLGLFEDREANVEVLRQLQEKPCLRYETLPLHTQDGQRREVEFVSTLYQANGHPVIQCSIRDITERKRAEATVRRLFDSSLIGIFVADFAGTFLEANDAFLDLLGYSREDLLAGTMQRDALTPPQFRARSHKALKALQETGASGTYETEYLQKSGKRIPVLVAMTRMEYTETCVGFVLDIRERKELDLRKDAFLITASHELRTPLTIIQGYLELLGEADNFSPERRRFYLNNACRACDELVLLLTNIMDASRIEFDKLDLHCSHLLLKDVCTALVALFEPLILLEQRQVVLDMADHVTVWADEMRLKQVLRNLIANALHYSPQRTPICIAATLEQDNRLVRISVIDRGQGIPLDKQQVIFDKFVRLERDMHSPIRGSGLGLYISRQLVEAMQGTITMTSSGVNGEGSSFSFTLPASDEAKTVASSPIASTAQEL